MGAIKLPLKEQDISAQAFSFQMKREKPAAPEK